MGFTSIEQSLESGFLLGGAGRKTKYPSPPTLLNYFRSQGIERYLMGGQIRHQVSAVAHGSAAKHFESAPDSHTRRGAGGGKAGNQKEPWVEF